MMKRRHTTVSRTPYRRTPPGASATGQRRRISRPTLLVAHSAFGGTRPNSLATVEHAHRAALDGVEFDLRCSADRLPVVAHDGQVYARHGGRIVIADTRLDAIVSAEPIHRPTLDEVVRACRIHNLLLNLDIKDVAVLPAVKEILTSHDYLRHSVLTGCTLEEIVDDRPPIPGVSLLVNLHPPPRLCGKRRETMERELDRVVQVGGQGINVDHHLVDEWLIRAAHRRFLSVSVWTVYRRRRAIRLEQMGVDSITTMVAAP